MTILKTETLAIRSANDVVVVRQKVRALAAEIGLSLVDQTKIVTAASELARNALVHGGGGIARTDVVHKNDRVGLQITFEDQGPGIPDLNLALIDGYSTSKGLGMGLSGSKRLVNQFDIFSEPGKGTRIVIARWK
jgi:serine/threonine-protein kinase RsbT